MYVYSRNMADCNTVHIQTKCIYTQIPTSWLKYCAQLQTNKYRHLGWTLFNTITGNWLSHDLPVAGMWPMFTDPGLKDGATQHVNQGGEHTSDDVSACVKLGKTIIKPLPQAVIKLPHCRLTAHSSWGEGLRTKPTAGVRSRSSSVTPGGGVKRKRWRRVVKKRKSSILARLSPRHTLRPVRTKSGKDQTCMTTKTLEFCENKNCIIVLPAEKAMKASLLINLPSLSRKWDGLKVCGLSHSLSSYRTEVSRGNTIVPCMQMRKTSLSHTGSNITGL